MSAEEIIKLAGETDQSEWCSDYCYSAIRHVQRNVDIYCSVHGDDCGLECGQFGRYDGTYIASVCPKNIVPLLSELIKLRSVVGAMLEDHAFAELCQSIGEEPQWLMDARTALAKAEGR